MAKNKANYTDYFICPHCGAEVAVGAVACRECGASDESGWGEANWESDAAGYGEDEDFDYDEFISREFPEQATANNPYTKKRVIMTVLVVVIGLIGTIQLGLFPGPFIMLTEQ